MKNSDYFYHIKTCLIVGFVALILSINTYGQVGASTDIKNEFLHVESKTDGLPLPLVALWSVGEKPEGFTPDYQIQLITLGRHILPSFHLSSPMGGKLPWSYYQNAIDFSKKNNLPICLVGTQFEHLLTDEPSFFKMPTATNPNVVDSSGKIEAVVSPFGPVDNWEKAGKEWTVDSLVKMLQTAYPAPPGVIFLSNNEHPTLKMADLNTTSYYAKNKSALSSPFEAHRVVGEGWISRYRQLQTGMTEGLTNSTWKKVSRYVGYNAYQFSIGNSYGWLDSSLYIPGRLQPWPLAWDGASLSYYVRPYDDSSDHTWFSPQIHAMNWPFMSKETRRDNPNFWIELSVWDGGKDQRDQYARAGQVFSPERYRGMVQFGAWLLRPRVVREFRMWDDTLKNEGKYLDAVLDSVDVVYNDPVLTKFWRYGRLLPNRQRQHPYQSNIPAEYASEDRWFLLETVPALDKYQSLTAEIPVFALALELGTAPKREWLIYAHSPLKSYSKITFNLEPFGQVSSAVSPVGVFLHIDESSRSVQVLDTVNVGKRPLPPVIQVQ